MGAGAAHGGACGAALCPGGVGAPTDCGGGADAQCAEPMPLLALPTDVVFLVCDHLPSRDLARVSAASRSSRALAEQCARRRAVAACAARDAPALEPRGRGSESWCGVLRAAERMDVLATPVGSAGAVGLIGAKQAAGVSLSVGGGHTSTGGGHTAVLGRMAPGDTAATVWLFGNNAEGQCGAAHARAGRHVPPGVRHTLDLPPLPRMVGAPREALSVACGNDFTLVLASDGAVLSCGSNARGQRGIGAPPTNARPTAGWELRPAALPMWVEGAGEVCARTDGTESNARRRVVAIAAGHCSSLALLCDATLLAWGLAPDGALQWTPAPDDRLRNALRTARARMYSGLCDNSTPVSPRAYTDAPPSEAVLAIALAKVPDAYAAGALTARGDLYTWGSALEPSNNMQSARRLLGREGPPATPQRVRIGKEALALPTGSRVRRCLHSLGGGWYSAAVRQLRSLSAQGDGASAARQLGATAAQPRGYSGGDASGSGHDADGSDRSSTRSSDLGDVSDQNADACGRGEHTRAIGRPPCEGCRTPPANGRRVVGFSLGATHGACVDARGVVWAWGANEDGQCGLRPRRLLGSARHLGQLRAPTPVGASASMLARQMESDEAVVSCVPSRTPRNPVLPGPTCCGADRGEGAAAAREDDEDDGSATEEDDGSDAGSESNSPLLDAIAVSAGYDYTSVVAVSPSRRIGREPPLPCGYAWGANGFGEAYPRPRRAEGALERHEPMALLEGGSLGALRAVAAGNTHTAALVECTHGHGVQHTTDSRSGVVAANEIAVYTWGYRTHLNGEAEAGAQHAAYVCAGTVFGAPQ